MCIRDRCGGERGDSTAEGAVPKEFGLRVSFSVSCVDAAQRRTDRRCVATVGEQLLQRGRDHAGSGLHHLQLVFDRTPQHRRNHRDRLRDPKRVSLRYALERAEAFEGSIERFDVIVFDPFEWSWRVDVERTFATRKSETSA